MYINDIIKRTKVLVGDYKMEECIMAIEQYTESLTLKEMKCTIGKNDFGY